MWYASGVREVTTTAGTGTVTLTQVSGFSRFSQGFAVGDLASYAIRCGGDWEWGIGTVGASNTLARTTISATLVSGTYTVGGTAISLSGASTVICTPHGATQSHAYPITRSALNTAAAANKLSAGELYFISDEDRIAIGLSVSTYESFIKSLEFPAKIARMVTDAVGTSIAPSTGVGTYNTKWVMNSTAIDDIGTVADLTNSQFVVPTGYTHARIQYNCAWEANSVLPAATDTDLTNLINLGYRAGRIKDGSNVNYGNQRVPAVISNATTNVLVTTPIFTVTSGQTFAVYPAQTSFETIDAGIDLASSYMQIELWKR